MEHSKSKYYLSEGTVQCVVVREEPHFMHHFGRAEYQREIPILSDSIREQAQPIVDALNAGTMTQEQAIKALGKIYW